MKSSEKDKPTLAPEILSCLSPLEYHVTQEGGTERPFDNRYWNNHEEGIYVDVVTGEALFSSVAKYDSGSGWPSFFEPLQPKRLELVEDRSLGMKRTEVRSQKTEQSPGSHLGHVFEDGPAPTGLRYCINSAALKFIPKSELEAQGYGEWLSLFTQK